MLSILGVAENVSAANHIYLISVEPSEKVITTRRKKRAVGVL